jgi:hypothetical protein
MPLSPHSITQVSLKWKMFRQDAQKFSYEEKKTGG